MCEIITVVTVCSAFYIKFICSICGVTFDKVCSVTISIFEMFFMYLYGLCFMLSMERHSLQILSNQKEKKTMDGLNNKMVYRTIIDRIKRGV